MKYILIIINNIRKNIIQIFFIFSYTLTNIFNYTNLKKLPEILSCSLRTTITLLPCKIVLAIIAAKRPSKWPRPSINIG